MDRGAYRPGGLYSPWGCTESDTTESDLAQVAQLALALR